jgi:hypothetical protein
MTGKKSILAVATIGLAVLAAVVLAESGSPAESKPAAESCPYQVLSGQVNRDFDVVYVLDPAKGHLAVLKFEVTKDSLVPIAGRELTKDFGAKELGRYSMTTVQVSRILGLLYVTDQLTHKAIAYKVDIIQNTITPMTPIDLNTVFAGS